MQVRATFFAVSIFLLSAVTQAQVATSAPQESPTPVPAPAQAEAEADADSDSDSDSETPAPVTSAIYGPMVSEYLHQPSAEAREVAVYFQTHLGSKVQRQGVGYHEVKQSGGIPIGLIYEMGLSEKQSFGVRLRYLSETDRVNSTEYKLTGMDEPEIFFTGVAPSGRANIQYGAIAKVPFSKGEWTDNGRGQSANAGEFSLTPQVGAEIPWGSGVCGAVLSYTIRGERTLTYKGTDNKYEGGNNLHLGIFHEWGLAASRLGVGLFQNWTEESKRTAPTAFRTMPGDNTAAALYGRIQAQKVALLPRLDYGFRAANFERYQIIEGSIAARMVF